MSSVRTKYPDMETHQYNRIFESVYDVLSNDEIVQGKGQAVGIIADWFERNKK